MSNFVITSTSTIQQSLINGEYGYIAADGELVVSGTDAIVSSGSVQLAVLGNVTSFGDFGAFEFNGVDLDMVVGAAGSVMSISDNALNLNASSRIELTNLGAINADGIAITAATADTGTAINIFNAGTLTGSTAISASSGTGTVIISNTGAMFTNGTTISVSSSTGPTVLNNSGTIESSGSFAVFFATGNDKVNNTGTIVGNVLLGDGNDTYDGTYGYVSGRVDGSNGDDRLIGGAFAETFKGGYDVDYINAGGGNDTIQGSDFDSANDVYDGGDGVDTLEVDSDSNDLTVDLASGFASGGLFGFDRLISIENVLSGSGNDGLTGNGENNSLDGGGGDDWLIGGAGADDLIGGTGNDTADYPDSVSGVTVLLWNGTGAGGDTQGDTLTEIEVLLGSNHNDVLFGALVSGETLNGGAGNDYLNGLSGNDILIGGAGADTLVGDAGMDTADYSASGSGVTVRLWNGTGVGGDAQGDTLTGIESVIGSSLNDTLFGAVGSNETLNGGAGDDYLNGLSGNDSFIGGAGNDTLDGGAGADIFYFGSGSDGDTVSDFEDGTDQILLLNVTFGELTISALGGGTGFRVAVTADTSDYIDLMGVGMTIDAGDFA